MTIFARVSIFAASLSLLALTGLTRLAPALASKGGIDVSSPVSRPQLPPGFVSFGHIPLAAEQVIVFVENAKVTVNRDAGAGDITVSSNCPHNWNLTSNMVRQAGFSSPPKGVSMTSDVMGARAIVNGRIYVLPAGPIKGLSMGKEGVLVGGQKVDPLVGSDLPGQADGPDAVIVNVPEKYTGSLLLAAAGSSEVQVASWNGGKLEATIIGNANLSAGNLKSLSKAVVDMRSKGKAEIGDISTKVLVANVVGPGSVVVKNGSADVSNATVSGAGSISLKGTYKNLKQAVEGQGTINISK